MAKSAKPDTWMPVVIGDYLGDTGHLTTEQHGAYFLLMMHYWRKGPPTEAEAGPITRLDAKAWKRSRPVLAALFKIDGDLWRHKRIDEERVDAAENKRKAVERASAGGRAKEAKRQAAGAASSSATSTPKALLKKCSSPSSTEEEGAFSPTSSLSGGAAVRSSVPADVRAAFADTISAEWERSYIAPCGWIDETRTLVPKLDLSAGIIRRDGLRVLRKLAADGDGITVDAKATAA